MKFAFFAIALMSVLGCGKVEKDHKHDESCKCEQCDCEHCGCSHDGSCPADGCPCDHVEE